MNSRKKYFNIAVDVSDLSEQQIGYLEVMMEGIDGNAMHRMCGCYLAMHGVSLSMIKSLIDNDGVESLLTTNAAMLLMLQTLSSVSKNDFALAQSQVRDILAEHVRTSELIKEKEND